MKTIQNILGWLVLAIMLVTYVITLLPISIIFGVYLGIRGTWTEIDNYTANSLDKL